MSDDPMAETLRDVARRLLVQSVTSEREHHHTCPRCGQMWLHADDNCGLPAYNWAQALDNHWAQCPICQEG